MYLCGGFLIENVKSFPGRISKKVIVLDCEYVFDQIYPRAVTHGFLLRSFGLYTETTVCGFIYEYEVQENCSSGDGMWESYVNECTYIFSKLMKTQIFQFRKRKLGLVSEAARACQLHVYNIGVERRV